MPRHGNRFGPGRVRRERRIGFLPDATFFKPQGIPMFDLKIVVITHEELEAIRLVDFLGMEHEESAQKMGISRKTMAKDLKNGRKKIADAILHGKAIQIEGGNFVYRRGNEMKGTGGNEDAKNE